MSYCTCNNMDKRCEEYKRLKKLPKISINKGDIVLVAVGLVGHGFEWVRRECRVLQVRKNSAEITFQGEFSLPGDKWWVKWVDRALVTDMVHGASPCCTPCHCHEHHCCCDS